ncbi:hypothetical protein [Acinetobacter ursingii]|uniref:hypothetical protein n=1 Tax=Acinetobacter ursingii TaxID=108980 RepID=UPI001D18FAD6|nr:hypothetical protein [Acinetobacter ursingii]
MARFIKVENIVVNVDLICAVTERFVRERIPTQGDDLPFDDYVSVSKGVNVFFGTTLEDSFISFENETVDSFLAKFEGGVMDIEKEKIAHEKHLLSQGVDFKYLPNIQYNELENIYELIEWDEEYSEALNEINSSWCTWQAAKAQAVSEGRTDFEIINSMKEVS